MADADVTVVVPTLALRDRAAALARALDSILHQEGVRARPLVVVNGRQRDPELLRALLADRRLQLLQREQPGLPEALHAGRAAVETPWFATLDDDDELLPRALHVRLQALREHADRDVVVTNGYRHASGVNVLHVAAGAEVAADPLRALLRRNWMLPGSWLARTAALDEAVFAAMPRYLECTYLATRFALGGRMLWLDEPTVRYSVASPHAASTSDEYALGQADALRAILALELPAEVRQALGARIADACHGAADHELRRGHTREAWRWHAATLREAGGWRHVPFLRHLLLATWRDAVRPGDVS